MRYSSLPIYDERWFEELHKIVSVEEVFPRDKVMMGMLASLGIQKGKPLQQRRARRRPFDGLHRQEYRQGQRPLQIGTEGCRTEIDLMFLIPIQQSASVRAFFMPLVFICKTQTDQQLKLVEENPVCAWAG